ncbi:unnamed protein product [Linum tenue]|uniref:Uncharacterized protein n=1 Tax=Linum tenue TaxID=586396 RepID=A0AAV0QVD8_9ROSI|nr:unnamed protein product [Linum tenue]
MFGRLRPPSSSLDSLEMERSHSKFLKDDSLSVYEATLMKLKLGSQRAVLLPPHPDDDPMDAETDSVSSSSSSTPSIGTSPGFNSTIPLNPANSTSQPPTTAAGSCASFTISSSSSDATELKHQVSVLQLFSKYKVSRQDESISSDRGITTMTVDYGVSVNNSPSSVGFPSSMTLGGGSSSSSSSNGYSAD